MLPELTAFLARFSPVSPEEAQALMPAGHQAVYCLYSDEVPDFYFGRTKNPLKSQVGGQLPGCNSAESAALSSTKSS